MLLNRTCFHRGEQNITPIKQHQNDSSETSRPKVSSISSSHFLRRERKKKDFHEKDKFEGEDYLCLLKAFLHPSDESKIIATRKKTTSVFERYH